MIFDAPVLTDSEEAVLEKIRKLWNELHANLETQPKRWAGLLARNLRAGAIRGSNSIEGFHVSKEDALAAVDGDEPAEAGTAAWNAVIGYRTAMEYVLRLGSVLTAENFRRDLTVEPITRCPRSDRRSVQPR